jgi:aryl-alcohol dehydrogenase-like predicted oxidoreductase
MCHYSTKGIVLEKKVTSADATIINRTEKISMKKNCMMSQIALAWVGSKVSSTIVGIVEGIEPTQKEIKYLDEPYVFCSLCYST